MHVFEYSKHVLCICLGKEKSTAGTGFITLADRALDGTVR